MPRPQVTPPRRIRHWTASCGCFWDARRRITSMGNHGKRTASAAFFMGKAGPGSSIAPFVPLVFLPLRRDAEKNGTAWEKSAGQGGPLNLAEHETVMSICCWFRTNSATKSCSQTPFETRCAQFLPNFSIASHEIPWHPLFIERRDGQTKLGAAKTPNKGEKDRLIQATAFV